MVQFQSIFFFLEFLQFLLDFSKVPVFCVTLYFSDNTTVYNSFNNERAIGPNEGIL